MKIPPSIPTIQRPRMPVVAQLGVLGILLVLVLGTRVFISNEHPTPPTETPHTTQVAEVSSESESLSTTSAFENQFISARAAVVLDASTGEVMYEKNAHEAVPLASLTKLMTALIAHEILRDEAMVDVEQDAIAQLGDNGLLLGEIFTHRSLRDLMLMTSANDGAYALAKEAGTVLDKDEPVAAFVRAMNVKADELSLTTLYFRNPTGLDISTTEAGAYGSALDVAMLLAHMVTRTPEVLVDTTKGEKRYYNAAGAYHNAANTNYAVADIPGLIASKTGYTNLAEGNLAIAFNAALDRPIIVVVLGSTYSGRFRDTLSLSSAARDAL